MVGNLIRGIGETPIMPLGISYIEDFAKSENSPLYIGKFEKLDLGSFLTKQVLGWFKRVIDLNTCGFQNHAQSAMAPLIVKLFNGRINQQFLTSCFSKQLLTLQILLIC